jgi:hypothetical protein
MVLTINTQWIVIGILLTCKEHLLFKSYEAGLIITIYLLQKNNI